LPVEVVFGVGSPPEYLRIGNLGDIDTDSDEEEIGDTIVVRPRTSAPREESEQPTENTQTAKPTTLPTPENTPEPVHRASREIVGNVGPSNVVQGSRTKRPTEKARQQAYFTDLDRPEELPGYHAAFAAGIQYGRGRLHRDQMPPPPRTWKDLQTHPYREGFHTAATKEYQDLERRNTFKSVPKTSKMTTIPLIWVFTYKFDTDGYLVKFKARLCVRDDLQPLTNQDNYAATLAARTFRALMATTAAFNLETWQADAVNAFTNSDLDETVYCDCPEGFKLPGSCLRLLHALYELRRSPLLWLKEFSGTLIKLGLTQVGEDVCLFANDWLIVFFYMNDIVALCRTIDLPKLQQLKQALMEQYELKDLGELSWFLGIRVIRDRSQRKLWLCQDSYVDKITKKFHLEYAKPAYIPMHTEELVPYEGTATPQEIYQQKVGSLQYAATITRPDMARTTSKLSEFLQNPSPQHQGAVNQALAYLQKTKTLAIEYSAETNNQQVFVCASDAAFADDTATRRSTEGYLFKLFGGAIDWHSTKQKTVTASSTEAELRALAHAAKETFWWKRFFQSIELDPGHDLSISCDNQQTIGLLTKETAKLTTKLRHIDIHHHWMRQEVQAKRIQINWIPTAEMPADGLTKALPRQKHETFVRQLGLVDIRERLECDNIQSRC
jgi:hypothetical protein